MERIKRLLAAGIGPVLLSILPTKLLWYYSQLAPPPKVNPNPDPELNALLQKYIQEPPNPLREAMDNRVFPFGSRW